MDKLERIQAILNDDDYPDDGYEYTSDLLEPPRGVIAPRSTGTITKPASATLTISYLPTDEHPGLTVALTDLQTESISQSYETITVDNFSMTDDYTPHYNINLLASRELVQSLNHSINNTINYDLFHKIFWLVFSNTADGFNGEYDADHLCPHDNADNVEELIQVLYQVLGILFVLN